MKLNGYVRDKNNTYVKDVLVEIRDIDDNYGAVTIFNEHL